MVLQHLQQLFMQKAMTTKSQTILEHFQTNYRKVYGADIDLTLRPAYRTLLKDLGNPEQKLPPVFHVAGTNGKGSTCAFMRSILESAGYGVHVYTSPHLVQFNERIRINGKLIEENELAEILQTIQSLSQPGTITYFEAATAAAFVAFARHPADFAIIEVGLGGRLDCTNVIEHPLASIITRISYDHREFLGDSLSAIAGEKAGIMRSNIPCYVGRQASHEVLETLQTKAGVLPCPFYKAGQDWTTEPHEQGFVFQNKKQRLILPRPALLGDHQLDNAGLAIAALDAAGVTLPVSVIKNGLLNVEWPARLQQLSNHPLRQALPAGWELWLDGGHNDSAGEVLAQQAAHWAAMDAKPLYIVLGMLTTKKPLEFLAPPVPHLSGLCCVAIPNEPQSHTATDLATIAHAAGEYPSLAANSLSEALHTIKMLHSSDSTNGHTPARILICGSLYLAGHVLGMTK